jgi:peptidyl-prolyl cis-trans isomerase D
MMNFFRRFASTWVGKILGGLLLIGLAGFGISNVITDLGTNDLTKVGDQTISIQDFQRVYQQQLNQYAQQTGQTPSAQQALQMGIPTSVLNQLAGDAAVNDFAAQQGVGVSDAQLAKMTRQDPNFFGVLGTFDRSIFDQAIENAGYTEAQYFDLETRNARRDQVQLGLFTGMPVPQTAAELLNRYRNDTRTVEYFTVNATSIGDIPTPTDDDLKAYLTAHQADFRTKETRTVDVLALTPDVLASEPDYQPTEDAIKAEYDRTKGSLSTPEKRDIQQVALSDDAKATFFQQQHDTGVSFADALKASGLKATDFGTLAKTEVQDAALADAAFGLTKEGDYTIIPGIGGKRVVAVTKIEAGGTASYDVAKPAIAKMLALQKAKNDYPDVQDAVEGFRAGLKPLKDIATRYKLTVTTVPLTADGAELSADPAIAEADRAKVAAAVFKATQGKLAPTVTISSTNNVYFDLSKVEPARDQTFDEVKDAVATAWTNDKTNAAIQALVKSLTADLDGGKSFQDVAAAHSQFATVSQPITREGDKTNVLNQAVATAIFTGGPTSHGSAIDGDGEYVIYHVVDAQTVAAAPGKDIADFLDTSTRNGLYSDFVTGVTDETWPLATRQVAYQRMLAQLMPAQ